MSKFAWVTLTTNDTYSLGALVLANSLKKVGTAHQLAVLVTPNVSEAMKQKLKDAFNVVQDVDVLDSKDEANLALLARPELGITFTKLHCWRLVQFEKCVFLDADTLVLQNCDELFEREELSAAPDVSWPDCFNSGVFVYRPNLETFKSLIEFAVKNGSFDGGDQGLLNQYFSDWATKDISKHLPFTYNTAAYASYCYLPAFKQFRDRIKILHFAGKLKPWLTAFDSQSKKAQTPAGYEHAAEFIQLWWNLYCEHVHQRLEQNMITKHSRYFYSSSQFDHEKYYSYPTNIDNQIQQPIVFHDPWEDYYEKLENYNVSDINNSHGMNYQQNNINFEQNQSKEINQSNDNNINNTNNINNNQQHERNNIVLEYYNIENAINNNFDYNSDNRTENNTKEYNYDLNNKNDSSKNYNNPSEYNINEPQQNSQATSSMTTHSHKHFTHTEKEETQYEKQYHANQNTQQTSSFNIGSSETKENNSNLNNINNYENKNYSENNKNEILNKNNQNNESESGLAGILSNLKLGEPKSPEQEAYENAMRRQCWESGNIDYTGKDAFDNIWKKISKTIDSKPKTEKKESANLLTSADIEDGKIEYDRKTGATIQYKIIPGGWTKTITTPQPNGTKKSETKTFYDPVPVTDEEEIKKLQKRTDGKTTVEHRKIPGGREEIYTTVYPDGTSSTQVKTFYESAEAAKEHEKQLNKAKDTTTKKNTTAVQKVRKQDSEELQHEQQYNRRDSKNISKQEKNSTQEFSEETVEEHRRVTKKTGKQVTKSDSIEEQNVQSIQTKTGRKIQKTDSTEENVVTEKKDTKKKKRTSAPPPPTLPPEFADGKTTVTSKKVRGGTEYTYTTVNKEGKTMTSTKTVYDEQEVEMTEEEIKQYQKQLKDAKKHENIQSEKTLKTKDGSIKKIVPSDNPGEVTTVEEKRIPGGTEYHYTTVTKEGIVKKSSKTIYDPVKVGKKDGQESSEEEIIEEYEEEVIEPGEKLTKTIVKNVQMVTEEKRETYERITTGSVVVSDKTGSIQDKKGRKAIKN